MRRSVFFFRIHPLRRVILVFFLAVLGRMMWQQDPVVAALLLLIAACVILDTLRWVWAWSKAYVAGP